ncbi:hypothetical protein [Hymenobacter jeollabukensis]|uniref:DUF481 domain-containing protein n=1 Tax=Hymenobacter jeollabukensis TaxID=2025313 RepID=A0A5R8WQR9_9BACT|nr:hypothetical protein [Hymenobacter jeollabukensis]TLM93098.1 hypothetical protein FDY95_10720 [Hymenobacter jeollabukensis]
MKRFLFPFSCALGLLAALLTSCSVYAPMQPTTSTIRHRGETELSASIQPNGRLEAGVVHSPMANVLVSGAATFRPKTNDSSSLNTRQWELGLGTYRALGTHWLLTGLAGGGYATTHKSIMTKELDIFPLGVHNELYQYDARYAKLFGQFNASYAFRGGEVGAAYRLTYLHFRDLNWQYNGYSAPIPVKSMLRHEPQLFCRINLDRQQPARWQAQAAIGMSLAQNRKAEVETWTSTEAHRTRLPMPTASLGVVFRPGRRIGK